MKIPKWLWCVPILLTALWILRCYLIFVPVHGIVSLPAKEIAEFNESWPLAEYQGKIMVIYLQALDREIKKRFLILPLSKRFFKRTSGLGALALTFPGWNQHDYDTWTICFMQDTPATEKSLAQWTAKLRSTADVKGNLHAP